jgi:tetratricopeptide (TPR) repeat protein
MIVVDTGSQDLTPVVARECGARVEFFDWCDDFSAARNESLKYATSDWIFWMDADDVIDEGNGRRLRELAACAPEDVFGFTAAVRCLPRPGEEAGVEVVDHVKLIRNHPGVRFEFHIHEQVLPSIRRLGKEVAHSEVYVTHAGYDVSPAGQQRKRERDLRLLGLDLKSHPDHPFVHFNMGMTALHLGNLELAEEHLVRSIQLAGPGESHVRKAYALLVASHRRQGAWAAARRTCEEGLAVCPDDPELLFNLGITCHHTGEHATAEQSYRRILEGRTDGPHLGSLDTGLTGYKARHNLAALYRDMGRPADAEQQLGEAVREEPAFVPSWFGLAELMDSAQRRTELAVLADHLCTPAGVGGVARLVRARLLSDEGRYAEALTVATEAIAAPLGPNRAHSLRLHSHLLLRLGRPAEAIPALRELVALTAGVEGDSRNLVLALLETGRHEEAAEACRTALEVDPTSPEFASLLATAERPPRTG